MPREAKFCSKCGKPLDRQGYVCSNCLDIQKMITREETSDYRKTHNKAVRIAVEQLKALHQSEYERLLMAAKVEVGLEPSGEVLVGDRGDASGW